MNKRTFIILLLIFILAELGVISYLQLKTPRQKGVTLVSDIYGIRTSLKKEQFLKDRLKELHFWDGNKVLIFQISGPRTSLNRIRSSTVKNLVIHLTNKPQALGKVISFLQNGREYHYQSYGQHYDDKTGQLDLFIFIHPDILRTESTRQLATRVSGMILYSIFDMTSPVLPELKNQSDRLLGLDDFRSKLGVLSDSTFVEIKR